MLKRCYHFAIVSEWDDSSGVPVKVSEKVIDRVSGETLELPPGPPLLCAGNPYYMLYRSP